MAAANESRTVRFGLFEVDLRAGELRKNGVKIKLQEQPFRVLFTLLEHAGDVVTREELRRELWPTDTFVDFDHGLNAAVKRLRDALDDSAENPRFIETLPRHGYRFISVTAPDVIQAEPTKSVLGRWGLPLIAVAILLVAVFLFAVDAGGLRSKILSRTAAQPHIRSLAVLPLTNISADREQEYFADGMTDALTTELAQIGSLRVISRTSAMHFKGTRETLPQIGRELNVDAVVEGSAVRAGDRIRITAQLIATQTDRHLWAKSYERSAQDVLALQDEVARDIAEEVRVKLTPEERTRLADARPINPEAHEAYLRGRFLWNQRTEDQLHKAKQYFEEAIAKEPDYAPAYSGLADTYFYLSYNWGHIPPREGMPLARAAALKAIELDPSAAEGHASLGVVRQLYDWDFPGAEQELKRAIALNPNYEMGHHAYSGLLAAEQRDEESVSEARKAVDVDPLSVPANNFLGAMLAAANRWDEAFTQSQKALELDPNPIHQAMFHGRIADYYREKEMTKEAIEEELKARAAQGLTPQEIEEVRGIYARSGRKGVLQWDLKRALKRWDKDHWHIDGYAIAALYGNLGDMDSSFQWIDKCIELRSTALIWMYIGDTKWKKDPRFAEVRRKMGVHY